MTDANEAAVGSRENSGVTRASYLGTRPDGRWVAGRLALKGRGGREGVGSSISFDLVCAVAGPVILMTPPVG